MARQGKARAAQGDAIFIGADLRGAVRNGEAGHGRVRRGMAGFG
jgi:hypothetical protein